MRRNGKSYFMAWQKGRDACIAGKSLEMNCYDKTKAKSFWNAWRCGWEQATLEDAA
jgi:ribosome modulation factor